ncbi:TraX family protein [Mycoplasmatota bacterium WC30]
MNRNTFKIIAAITMTFDHIGLVFLDPNSISFYIFRGIGRIAFVLFAYMIVEGFFKTSNLKRYFLRIFAYASIIEIFIIGYYFVSNNNYILEINVIWPLVFGLGALVLLKNNIIWIRLLSVGVVFLAEFIHIPYGAYGVLIIVILALYKNPLTQLLFLIGINLVFIDFPLLNYLGLAEYAKYGWIQWLSVLAFGFIYIYNGKKGKLNTKWFFYIFYPLHLGIIYLIYYLIN